VIETNLMGQVHGARAALPRFRRQGTGVLINMSSVWGRVSTPQVTPYIVSKNAVRAFSECLAGELVDEEEIEVATIVPQAIDTPIFEHGGNYTGRQVRPIPPVLDVEQVARGIELCAENPKREVNCSRAAAPTPSRAAGGAGGAGCCAAPCSPPPEARSEACSSAGLEGRSASKRQKPTSLVEYCRLDDRPMGLLHPTAAGLRFEHLWLG
jgi:hypothetical protein